MSGHLVARFRRAMLPLVVATGVLVATLPPALAWRAAHVREAAVAERSAEILARSLGELIARQPIVWRYNAPKVIEGARELGWIAPDVAVRVLLCDGRAVGGGEGVLTGIGVREAPLRNGGRELGRVQVASAAIQPTIWALAGFSVVFGAGLAFALWWIPAIFVRRQSRSLEDVLDRLAVEKAMVDALNDELHVRVEGAMRDVRTLGERVSSVQDDERRRIARELHDGLGQSLTALRLTIERDPEGAREPLRDLVERASAELRRSVHDLRPPELQPESLRASIEAIAEDFEIRTGIAVPRRWAGPDVRPGPGAQHVVRVLQEAMQNAARHGDASEIVVDVVTDQDRLRLRVEDDGNGFSVATSPRGMGLVTMRDRTRLCDGDFDIHAEVGSGCVVEATFARGTIVNDDAAGDDPSLRA